MNRVGVIGGSGLYAMEGLVVHDEVRLQTPFGDPSDAYTVGELDGKPVAFLARHGRGHRYSPTTVPYRANLYGFSLLGVRNLFSVSAVGSLRADVEPLHLAVPSQFVDWTRQRVSTYAEPGAVIHLSLADPVCEYLSGLLATAALGEEATVHEALTYLCIEGPQFSTRAESNLYRSWGMDIIGMTNATEAKLAREIGIAYATLAMVCDYDCWHDGHDDVTAEMAVANLMKSVDLAQRVLRRAVGQLPIGRESSCAGAARRALMTAPEAVPAEVRQRLRPLLEDLCKEQE